MGVLNAAVYGGGILAFQSGGPTSTGTGRRRRGSRRGRGDARGVRDGTARPGDGGAAVLAAGPRIASTIVGMSRPERVARTLDLAARAAPAALWPALEALVPPPRVWLDAEGAES